RNGAFRGTTKEATPLPATPVGSVAGTPAGGSGATPGGPQTLTMYIGSDPTTLDPALMVDVISITTISQLMEGLTFNDPSDLTPKPGAARQWNLSPDGKTYTFTLRDDLKWSNGETLPSTDS